MEEQIWGAAGEKSGFGPAELEKPIRRPNGDFKQAVGRGVKEWIYMFVAVNLRWYGKHKGG